VIVALWLMQLEPRGQALGVDQDMWAALREGLDFLRKNAALRGLVFLVLVPSTVGFPLQVLLPELASERLDLGADGYGFLLALSGLGALAGAIGLALLGGYRRRGRLVAVAAVVFALAVLGLGAAGDLFWAVVALVIIGWAQVTHLALSNTLLQDNVPDALRGRVLSAYIWVVVGFQPFGGLLLGAVAEGQGLQAALWLSGGLCLVAAVLGLVLMPQIRRIP